MENAGERIILLGRNLELRIISLIVRAREISQEVIFFDLGSEAKRWANLYTGDIELSNEGSEGNEVDGTTGKWTIQEGSDDLYLLNRKNGKKYRFKLEEIT